MAIGWANNIRSIPTGSADGDLSGTYPDPLVDGLQGEPVSADVPINGDILTFVVNTWKPSAPGSGGPPSGAAGGDLGGVYPTPLVVAVQAVPVSAVPPTAGQVLRETGGVWTPDTLEVADIVGAAPLASPTFTGTVDADGATAVLVPTVPFPDSSTNAMSTEHATLNYAPRLFLGDVKIVNSIADLDVHAPAVAGVRTVTGILLVTTILTLPIDDRFAFGAGGVLAGVSSAQCQIIGNYAGPIFSGSVVMRELGVANLSVNPAASVFAITAAGARTVRVEYCAVGAGAKAGTISNILGLATIDRMFMNGCAGGFVISGIIAAMEFIDSAASAMPAGSWMFDFDATTNVVRALGIQSCTMITTDASDRMIRIHSSATLPGGALPTNVIGVNILQNKITGAPGAIGKIYDTGLSTYDPESPRIIFRGNPTWPDSRFLGDADFASATTPIVTTYVGPAPTAWLPLAFENVGPTAVLTLLAVSSKFTLVRVSATDWYLRFDGPVNIFASVSWSVSIQANAGPGVGEFIEFRAEVQVGGLGPWVEIPGTVRRIEQRATELTGTGEAFVAVVQPADRFRFSSRNFSGTGSTDVFQYDLIVIAV